MLIRSLTLAAAALMAAAPATAKSFINSRQSGSVAATDMPRLGCGTQPLEGELAAQAEKLAAEAMASAGDYRIQDFPQKTINVHVHVLTAGLTEESGYVPVRVAVTITVLYLL